MAGGTEKPDLGRILAAAMAARARGDARGAAAELARARKASPGHPDVLHLGAILAHEAGRGSEALRLVDRAIAGRAGDARLLRSRGLICEAIGRRDDAIEAFRSVLAHQPADAGLGRHLAALLHRGGDLGGAIAVLKAVPEPARDADLRFELANLFRESGSVDAALPLYERACLEKPADVAFLSNLANCLALARREGEAAGVFARALALPVSPADGARLARAASSFHAGWGDKAAAIRLAETAVSLEPDVPGHRLALADLLDHEPSRAIAATWHRTRAVELDMAALRHDDDSINDGFYLKNRLAVIHLDEDGNISARAARRFGRFISSPPNFSGRPKKSSVNLPVKRLRVGYVSPDFYRHVIGNFALPIFNSHDRGRIELHGFSLSPRQDEVTDRYSESCEKFFNICNLTDDEAAEEIRAAEIDVLVDLAGLNSFCRPGIFLRRPAPVQVTYLGCALTTGLKCFDARIVDEISDPVGTTDALFSEPLLRLKGPFIAFLPIDPAPDPELRDHICVDRNVTFGYFGNLAKITQPVLSLWNRILQEIPKSRILIKNIISGDVLVRSDFMRMVSEARIPSERICLMPPAPNTGDHLRAYRYVDVALDTFPYGGTTTTFEALWMGVPVVTLAGRPHASRVGASILSHAGLGELVAVSPDDYVRICKAVATDLPRLQDMRASLRDRLLASPVCDAPALARRLEDAYLDLWRRWCDRTSPRT